MLVLISFVVFSALFCGANTDSNTTDHRPDVMKSWITLDNTLKGAVDSAFKYLMPKIMESSGEMNLSSQCAQQTFQLIGGLKNLKKWAFSFVDSSAKLSDGLLSGAVSSFGEYDQCLEIVVPRRPRQKQGVQFQGQYCMVEMRLPMPNKTKRYRTYDQIDELRNFTGSEVTKFLTTKAHFMYYNPSRIGLCIPSGCTKDDLNNILSIATSKIKQVSFKASYCETKKEHISLHGVQIFAIVLICFLIILVIVASWMEMNSSIKIGISTKLFHRILLSFSAISNFKRLVSTKSSMENFRCLHGLRFFTIVWVVNGHAYLFAGLFVTYYRSLFRIVDRTSAPLAQLVVNGSESVDVFFFIAGMLVSYLTIKRVKLEKKTFNFPLFVFHRLFRIVPVTYFIILISFLFPLSGSGPIFHETMRSTFYPCFQEWWKNALFINNFFYADEVCLRHTWYISCDIQLYLISIVVILPLISSRKIGLVLNGLVILLSVAYTGIMAYIHDISPTITHTHMNSDDKPEFYLHSYANVISRAGPYFIGVFTGYLLVTYPHIKISKTVQAVGWLLAMSSSGMIVIATAIWHNVHLATPLESLIYAALYKIVFTSGMAWMTFCCITGHGGFVNTLLSWKFWIPLSKLVFLTYLIEPMLHTTYIACFKSPQEFSHFQFTVQFAGFLCISMLLALLSNLLVESPFLGLEKILFNIKHERKENDNGNVDCVDAGGKKPNGTVTHEADQKCFTRC